MNSLNAASSVMQGSKISSGDFIQYAEDVLLHFYEFEQFKKPMLNQEQAIIKNNQKEEPKTQPF